MAAGVNVCIGHDSVMDPWYPLGYGDPLQAAFVLAHLGQMSGDAELRRLLDMITVEPGRGARRRRLRPARRRPGRPGRLRRARPTPTRCAWSAPRILVLRGGRVVARTEPARTTVVLGRRRGGGHLPAPLSIRLAPRRRATSSLRSRCTHEADAQYSAAARRSRPRRSMSPNDRTVRRARSRRTASGWRTAGSRRPCRRASRPSRPSGLCLRVEEEAARPGGRGAGTGRRGRRPATDRSSRR